jgi:hypothetical protein
MTLYMSEPVPISTIPPTSAIPGQTSFVPPLTSTSAGGDAAAGVRYTIPHTPQPPPTDHLSETTARIWEGVEARLRDMGLSAISHRIYQKLSLSIFDSVAYPAGWRVPNFSKFDGEGSRTKWEHVSQYLAQLGEAGSVEALRVRLFSLSLTGATFAWFSSLPAHSIYRWETLEWKFHEHFYSGTSEAKLADLTSVKQTCDELVSDYFKRFKEIKSRYFNLTIFEKDLADLAFQAMHSYLREKLEGHIYLLLMQLQQFALVQENRIKNTKEIARPSRRKVHVVEHSSDDESGKVLTTEFVWPLKAKSLTCDALKPTHKKWQDDIKYTFDVAKCDKILDELHKGRYIKLPHTLPPLEDLKQ